MVLWFVVINVRSNHFVSRVFAGHQEGVAERVDVADHVVCKILATVDGLLVHVARLQWCADHLEVVPQHVHQRPQLMLHYTLTVFAYQLGVGVEVESVAVAELVLVRGWRLLAFFEFFLLLLLELVGRGFSRQHALSLRFLHFLETPRKPIEF